MTELEFNNILKEVFKINLVKETPVYLTYKF